MGEGAGEAPARVRPRRGAVVGRGRREGGKEGTKIEKEKLLRRGGREGGTDN